MVHPKKTTSLLLFFSSIIGAAKHISVSDNSLWAIHPDGRKYTAENIRFTDEGKINLNWDEIYIPTYMVEPYTLNQISVHGMSIFPLFV